VRYDPYELHQKTFSAESPLPSPDEVIEQIQRAFAANPYPGDHFLQGSFEGCEPGEEVGAFVGKTDWRALDSKMLDAHYTVLSFFSEAGFRFFLPAYLIADLRDELRTADPVFHLSHGFMASVGPTGESPADTRDLNRAEFVNPRRYGAITWADYYRYRLSVFTREEAQAIVSYLVYKRERDAMNIEKPRIDAALEKFWLGRAEHAPTAESLKPRDPDSSR
jgi:hypothetical protein